MKLEECNFGKKYQDACFSSLDLPDHIVKKIFDWVQKGRHVLTFCGSPGVGKTYTCAALVKRIDDANHKIYQENQVPTPKGEDRCRKPSISLYYFNESDFFESIHRAIKTGEGATSAINKYVDADYFILNDLGVAKDTEWYTSLVFDIVDKRNSWDKPTLITSNLWLSDMETRYGKRFTSRLQDKGNVVIEFQGEDLRQKQY